MTISSIEAREIAECFYEAIFSRFPGIRQKFASEHKQLVMFESALKTIDQMKNGDGNLDEYLKLLGTKHRGHRLLPIHFEYGLVAIKEALEKHGANLSDERKEKIVNSFSKLTGQMGF